MAYVIAEPCIGTKDSACVDACPVDCIHPKKDSHKFATEEMLYIDPVECIDCGACVPVCPVTGDFRSGRSSGKVEELRRAQREVLRKIGFQSSAQCTVSVSGFLRNTNWSACPSGRCALSLVGSS